jgi:hypothetical protein
MFSSDVIADFSADGSGFDPGLSGKAGGRGEPGNGR